MKKEYTREELIDICKEGVVDHRDWSDRDSHSAQYQMEDIYIGLMSGFHYTYKVDDSDRLIYITFYDTSDRDLYIGGLDISSVEDYRRDCDPEYETEMFEGHGINFNTDHYPQGYLPTRTRLDNSNGGDWY